MPFTLWLYDITLQNIYTKIKYIPYTSLYTSYIRVNQVKWNSDLHYIGDKNHNDSKLIQKAIILKVYKQIMYIHYYLAMFKFLKHNVPI